MFYSSESSHGSSSSHGFSNDTVVFCWKTKKDRDNYINKISNISARSIRRCQVTKQATNWSMTQNKNCKPNPFMGEFWAVCHDENNHFERNDYDGYVGYISYGTIDSLYDMVKRFY